MTFGYKLLCCAHKRRVPVSETHVKLIRTAICHQRQSVARVFCVSRAHIMEKQVII